MVGAKGVFNYRVPKDLGAKSSGGNKNPGGKSSDAKNVVAPDVFRDETFLGENWTPWHTYVMHRMFYFERYCMHFQK